MLKKVKSLAQPPSAPKKFYSLKEFLEMSNLSYTTYRRMRQDGRAPQEHRLSAKTIRIKVSEATKWLRNPPPKKPQATEESVQPSSLQ